MRQRIRELASYLYQQRNSVWVLGLGAVLAALMLYLYQLPMDAIGYLLLLWAAAAAFIGLPGFLRFSGRHRQLDELKHKVIYELDGLPEPEDLLARDYTELLQILYREKAKAVSESDGARKELIDYFSIWAHQIKTPIAAMRLVLQSEESSQNHVLEAELFRIEQYVEMVLSYLRLDSDTTDFVIQEYSLDGIVRQAVKKYAPFFIHGKIRLDLQPLTEKVLTDEKWLVFVVEQILSNALKYTRRGKISVYEKKDGETGAVSLVIADTGIGIAAEDLPRVCEKGYTGYNGRSDKKASGIGLYLCRKILNKLSHAITLESRPGAGTKVYIRFEPFGERRQ